MPSTDDPAFDRAGRRRRSKEAAAAASQARIEELRQRHLPQSSVPARNRVGRTTLPTTAADPIPDLIGSFDLVYPVHSLSEHMEGPDKDWLFLNVFPHSLRPNGWVYVKIHGRVCGRVQVRRIGFRRDLSEHTPDGNGVHHVVASSPTLELHAETWQPVNFPAAETHQQGFRYITTDDERGTVTHLVGGAPTQTHPLGADVT